MQMSSPALKCHRGLCHPSGAEWISWSLKVPQVCPPFPSHMWVSPGSGQTNTGHGLTETCLLKVHQLVQFYKAAWTQQGAQKLTSTFYNYMS